MTDAITGIRNAQVVLPDRVMHATVVLADGKIAGISERPVNGHPGLMLDARERFVVPGLVDLHTDALERHAMPRPHADFPADQAFHAAARELASAGITTPLHAVAFLDATPGGIERARELCLAVDDLGPRGMLRHRLHVRCEVPEQETLPALLDLLAGVDVTLVSLMDHTPSRGQFRDPAAYRRFLVDRGVSEQHMDAVARRPHDAAPRVDDERIGRLAAAAAEAGAVLASHDDDDPRWLRSLAGHGVALAEFPLTLAAARTARSLGLPACMGAPNVVRGESSSGNLSALEAIEGGLVDSLCSDYHTPSLLHAPFRLAQLGVCSLPRAVRMVSAEPARIARLDHAAAIAEGEPADLLVVDAGGALPHPTHTIVGGRVTATAVVAG